MSKASTPPSFVDNKGRRWAPYVTGNTVCKYEKDTGISLFQAVLHGGAVGAVPGWNDLMILLYLSIEEQVAERKVTFVDFVESMRGKSIPQAKVAIQEAVFDFFPEMKDMIEVKNEASTDPKVEGQNSK